MVYSKHYAVALPKGCNQGPRLHARTLLGEHELAAFEIARRIGQQEGDLQRKDMRAVEVLMQAVVVAGPVAQQQRRRPRLAGAMAAAQELVMGRREPGFQLHRLVPAIGDRRQQRIERAPQAGDDARQRIGKVAVLATPVAMARHHDAAAKAVFGIVEGGERAAFRRLQQAGDDGVAIGIERGGDGCGIEARDARLDALAGEGFRLCHGGDHSAPSARSSIALRSTPQR